MYYGMQGTYNFIINVAVGEETSDRIRAPYKTTQKKTTSLSAGDTLLDWQRNHTLSLIGKK